MIIGLCYDLLDTYHIESPATYKDFSLLSEVEHVEKGLKKLGHKVILINGLELFIKNISYYKKECDLIFNMIEGYKSRNREGLLPALCEAFAIPYTGTDSFGMSLSLNKYHMNQVLKSLGIKVPNSYVVNYPIIDYQFAKKHQLGFPCVIKPNHEGSSMGIEFAYSQEDLINKVYNISKTYKQQIIVEEYVKGSELSIGVLGSSQNAYVYSCLQMVNSDDSDIDFFDYASKHDTEHKLIYPRIEKRMLDKICCDSLIIHRMMQFNDVSRIDWKVNKDTAYLIETTPLPDFNVGSDFDQASEMVGEKFDDVLQRIIMSALEKKVGEK